MRQKNKKVLTSHKTCHIICMKGDEKMEALKEFRISLGLSKLDFAKEIGVSFSLYKKIESGEREPSRNFIQKLKITYPQFDTNLFFAIYRHDV